MAVFVTIIAGVSILILLCNVVGNVIVIAVIQTRFTLEETVPDSWRIRNVLVPDWSCRLHTSERIRIKTPQFGHISGDLESGI